MPSIAVKCAALRAPSWHAARRTSELVAGHLLPEPILSWRARWRVNRASMMLGTGLVYLSSHSHFLTMTSKQSVTISSKFSGATVDVAQNDRATIIHITYTVYESHISRLMTSSLMRAGARNAVQLETESGVKSPGGVRCFTAAAGK